MPAPRLRAAAAALIALSLPVGAAAPLAARAQSPERGEVPLVDLVDLLVVDRELVAIRSAGQLTIRLELDERLLWHGSRGAVALALTDRRMLGAATRSAAWQTLPLRRQEPPPEAAQLGDRVALFVTDDRIVGFNGETGNFAEFPLGVRESVRHRRVGANTAVVVTDRNAVGLSAFAGGFFAAKLGLREQVEAVEALANLATVTTNRRLLIFRAASGVWTEKNLALQ
jgi:hypothetical protein